MLVIGQCNRTVEGTVNMSCLCKWIECIIWVWCCLTFHQVNYCFFFLIWLTNHNIICDYQMGLPLCSRLILLITWMITDQIGLHSVLPITIINFDLGWMKNSCFGVQVFLLLLMILRWSGLLWKVYQIMPMATSQKLKHGNHLQVSWQHQLWKTCWNFLVYSKIGSTTRGWIIHSQVHIRACFEIKEKNLVINNVILV